MRDEADSPKAQEERRRRIEELRKAIAEGIESGPGIPADEVFARLEAKYRDADIAARPSDPTGSDG